jgi:hypothetical protein
MYGWMWSNLPGPVPVRVLLSLLIAALVIVVLFMWVFPAVDELLLIDDSEVSSYGETTALLR